MLAAVSASDVLMSGVISQDALSAVSLAGQITFVFNLFMGGLTMGTSILAAQYYGKGDKESIEKIFGYVTRISFLISIVFFCASLFAPSVLMRIFTGEPQLISGGVSYLRIVSVSYLFTGISQIYLCILKNTDYAMKSMAIGSSAVVINLFLNAALIYGLWFFPEMGIAGAADLACNSSHATGFRVSAMDADSLCLLHGSQGNQHNNDRRYFPGWRGFQIWPEMRYDYHVAVCGSRWFPCSICFPSPCGHRISDRQPGRSRKGSCGDHSLQKIWLAAEHNTGADKLK